MRKKSIKEQILFKSIWDVEPCPTSHGCGEKRVLLSSEETTSAFTQIAMTTLHNGERVLSHFHPTMEECFLIKSGCVKITVGDNEYQCMSGDFIRIPCGIPHQLETLDDSVILTIGCAIDNNRTK